MVSQDSIIARRFAVGVDLGQQVDASAITVVESVRYRTGRRRVERGRYEGAIRHVDELATMNYVRAAELLPLKLSYESIVEHIAYRFGVVESHGEAGLCFDLTGVGRAVGEMIWRRLPGAIGITLTASDSDQQRDPRIWSVSKSGAVLAMLAALDTGTLKIAEGISGADALRQHLVDLRRRVNTLGRFSFEAEQGRHDDLVISTALALWLANRPPVRVGHINTKGLGYDADRIATRAF